MFRPRRRITRDSIDSAWRREAARAGQNRLRRPSARRGPGGWPIAIMVGLALMVGWYARDWEQAIAPFRDASPASMPASMDMLSAQFSFCHRGGGTNCVVDGDTFWFRGEKYRIADIDTPETHGPRCPEEGALGARATSRLQQLMNAGPFSLEIEERETDRYGRALRIVTREGQSIGAMLVAEGLARTWDGRRHPWC